MATIGQEDTWTAGSTLHWSQRWCAGSRHRRRGTRSASAWRRVSGQRQGTGSWGRMQSPLVAGTTLASGRCCKGSAVRGRHRRDGRLIGWPTTNWHNPQRSPEESSGLTSSFWLETQPRSDWGTTHTTACTYVQVSGSQPNTAVRRRRNFMACRHFGRPRYCRGLILLVLNRCRALIRLLSVGQDCRQTLAKPPGLSAAAQPSPARWSPDRRGSDLSRFRGRAQLRAYVAVPQATSAIMT
jgi:hypothetical protein